MRALPGQRQQEATAMLKSHPLFGIVGRICEYSGIKASRLSVGATQTEAMSHRVAKLLIKKGAPLLVVGLTDAVSKKSIVWHFAAISTFEVVVECIGKLSIIAVSRSPSRSR